MKTQLETIQPGPDSSFSLLRNPRLSDLFFWHFHPEYELVYIEAQQGPRHVGDHISTYRESDLVLIGSNIPHLNFDYGLQTDYEKVVLHILPVFCEKIFAGVPELSTIWQLLARSQHGIVFKGATKKIVGKRLKHFHLLKPFEQFMEVIYLFQLLALSSEYELLHNEVYKNQYSQKEQDRLRMIYAYIDKHYQEHIELGAIAEHCSMTKAAFCRYFKKATGNTFIGFLNQYRVSQAKRLLLSGKTVSEACYKCGFESLSYFNRIFKKLTNDNPSTFKKKYI